MPPNAMKQKFKTYLRSHRRRWGLSQREVVYLIGLKSPSLVSRIELESYRPKLPVAFACHVIFGVPVNELFPGVYSEVEDAVMRRAYKLYNRLQGNPSATTRTKLDLLEQVLKRAAARNAT
jgi:DNA-binding XRE family transcriptional regulator